MPSSTPIYGIPYPCATDTIDATDFQVFADAVDAALTTVSVISTEALNRPAARVRQAGASTALVSGVVTTATYDTEVFDNDGMGDLGVNNDRLTVQTNGTYLVTANGSVSTAGGTLTSGSIALSINGTVRYRKKDGNTVNGATALNIVGVFDAVAGDIFRSHYVYTGTVGGSAILAQLEARMVNRP